MPNSMPHRRHVVPSAGLVLATGLACASTTGSTGAPAAPTLSMSLSASVVDRYDFVEATITADRPLAANPFTDVIVTAVVAGPGELPRRIEGFADDPQGRVWKVRFMPSRVGEHRLSVSVAAPEGGRALSGAFTAREGGRKGPVRIDRANPYHFVWEGSGQHYFWNSTTTYGIVGWDDASMEKIVDRLHRLRVNRIRATLLWRVRDGMAWFEPVTPGGNFTMTLNPWVAARPDDVDNPGFDVTRFNVEHFRKYERLLRLCRERDIVVSVIPYTDGARKGTDPFGRERMGNADEQRYYRYLVARFAAYANVMWDVTNEYHLFRDEAWVERMGTLVKEWDPYDHLTSVHGHPRFPFRKSTWVDFAMYQSWDEAGGHAFMLKNRQEQQKAGRPLPQINEEYGYEDHYPVGWGGNKKPPARSTDNRRRLAWGMTMAGGYQTTGERANTGTNHTPDTGGGWINGRGDDGMKLLEAHGYLLDFFTSFDWWRTEPRDELVDGGNHCLADVGRAYAVYLPKGGSVTVKVEPGSYRPRWFDPRTGRFTTIVPHVDLNGTWTSPAAPDDQDWALLIKRHGD
jgi:hypothetical protein